MKLKALSSLVVALACALGVEAAQPHVTTAVKHTGTWSIGTSYIYHIDPGGSVVVNKHSNGNCYIEIAKTTAGAPSELWVEGGTVQAETLALRGEYSTFRQMAGSTKLTGAGLLLDGGSSVGSRTWISGGTCEATINFRNCAIAEFRMSGGKLIAPSVGGANMGKANFYFDLTNDAYAVTGTIASTDRFAIKATTPIDQAPKTLTITGTPVSGCAYALVDGVTNDTFYASTTLSVPSGWELLRRGGKLFLVESATLPVKTATWTGAAGDGNPHTPGNWTCRDISGTVVEGVVPGVDATAVVPAECANFSFPKGQSIVLGELRFLGDRYELNAEADWRGLDFGVVTKAPAVIDVQDQVLRVAADPSSTTQLTDLTEPTGTARLTLMGNSTLHAGSVAALFDNVVSGSSRLLSGNFQGCAIDYDFGAGKGEIVRGVRFSCPSTARRPKALTISGTTADPATAADSDWTQLGDWSNMNVKTSWTDFLTFDNDTPYRAYRIKVTANMASDQYGNFLEFYEIEFAREARQPATEVTASVAGGELRFDVPADQYIEIAKTALAGSLKVVKDGEGTLGFKKTNQSFTGGVEALTGTLRTQGSPGSWIFGGASTENASATTITLKEGTMLDLWAYTGWGYTTLALDGGTIAGRTTQFNPHVRLVSSSTIDAKGDFTVPDYARFDDLGGNTLTLKIVSGSRFLLSQTNLVNGVIDVVSGGWFDILQPLDARTVDLKMGAALNVSANAAVRDYVAKYANSYNDGLGSLNVHGTFTPQVDYFYGCTMQDGSTINLASRTNEWLTTSRFSDGRRVVEFADDATVTIALGARRPARGERIVRWRTPPANLDSLTFAFTLDDAEATPEPAIATPTGIFYGADPGVVDRAYWTGAVDGDVTKSGNWACTNVLNQGVADALPGSIATIYLAGDCAMNAPDTNDVAYAWVICTTPITLAADCDWRGLDLNRIQDGAVIDLRGHKFFVSGFNGDTARTLTITDSTTGTPGELHVDVPQSPEAESATMFGVTKISIEGNTRLVKEGDGEFWMKRDHQAYTGGTDIVAGRLRPDLIDPINWPFGGDGIVDPGAMTITLRKDGKFYPAGKGNWANATFILDGGILEDWTTGFNAKIVVNADSQINVFSGDFVIPATADFCDLGGNKLTITVQSSRNLNFYMPRLENGTLDYVSGGWIKVLAPLDARSVDFHVGGAMVIGADLSVHDYEAKYAANNTTGTNVMTVCGTFIPTSDYFYGCTLADGAKIDLSSKTNAWSTTSAFTSCSRVVNFAPGAHIGVLLGERQFENGDQVIAWTEETAPADAQQLKFKPADHSGTLYVDDGGVYFRASGLVIFVR